MSTANGRPAAQQGDETVVSDDDEFEKAFAELNTDKPEPTDDGDISDDNDPEPADQDDTGDDPDNSGDNEPGGDVDDVGDDPGSEQDGGDDQGTDDGGKPDIWANADPALKAAFEAERAAREKAEQSARSNAGRITAYQRQISELQNSGQQAAARSKQQQGEAATDQKAAAQDAAAVKELKQDDQWRQFKEDYPDVAGPVESIISQMGQQVATQEAELAALNQERRNRHYDEQQSALTETHPDWQQVITSHEFIDWFNAAPPSIREMVERNANNIADAQTAGAALTLFKAQTGAFAAADPEPEQPAPNTGSQKQISGRRKRQLEAGTTGSARRSGGTNAGGPPDDFEAAFAYHARQAEKQRN